MQLRNMILAALILGAVLFTFNVQGAINIKSAYGKIKVLDGFTKLAKEKTHHIIGRSDIKGEAEGLIAPNSDSRKEVLEILNDIPPEYFIHEVRTENDKLTRFYVMPNDNGSADFLFAFIGKGGNDLAVIRLTGESESYYLQLSDIGREITHDEFEEAIASQNAELPMTLSEGIQLSSMYVNSQYMTIRVNLDTKGKGFVITDEEQMKKNGITMLTGLSKQLISQIFSLGMGLKIVFASETNDRKEIILERNELVNILNDEMTTIEDSLNVYIANNLKACPLYIDEGMALTDIYKKDGLLYMVYEIDENLYSIADFNISCDIIKENMISFIKSGEDELTKILLELLESSNHGLVFRYKGNTSKAIADIDFSVDEIMAVNKSLK